MKNIIKKFASLSAAVLMLTSCADFLDIEPVDTFSGEIVFSNLKTINGYVTQRYAQMKDPLGRQALRFACDEGWNTFDWYGVNGLQKGQMSPDFEGGSGSWTEYYSAIQNCNLFFDQIPGMETLKTDETSTKELNQYIAELTFLRAFFYADLVSRYGGVPLSKTAFKLGMPENEMYIERSSYDECLKFIVTELDKAAENLPVRHAEKDLGRATKGAALALKARVLLYAASELHNPSGTVSKWTTARDAIADVIFLNEDGSIDKNSGTKVYALDPEYAKLFKNSSSKEIIFQRIFASQYGHSFDQYNSPNGFHGWSETSVNQGLVDAYEMEDGTLPNPDVLYGASRGKEYEIGTTPWDGRDPRFYASIICDGQMSRGREIEYFIYNDTGGGKDSKKGGIEEWNSSLTGFYLRKFMDESLPVSFSDKSSVPWIYFRLGEMYLNYAEALYQTGNENEARFYLEKIRERARGGRADILPEITASGDDLMKAIQHERRIELAFEEHRFFDIRRWKVGETEGKRPIRGMVITKNRSTGKKTYKLNDVWKETKFSTANYYFAIPTSEIQKNGKLEQNPGYPGAN